MVSGDWNTARLWDKLHPGARGADFFTRAEEDGWVDVGLGTALRGRPREPAAVATAAPGVACCLNEPASVLARTWVVRAVRLDRERLALGDGLV